jgi:hypothetical protein
MCLFSRTPIPSIAQEDIFCYKMFETNPIGSKLLMTPYRLVTVKSYDFPCMFTASSNKCINPVYEAPFTNNILGYKIGPGFIHAYTHPIYITSYRFCVVLCKIHKGTKYYVSTDGKEICASQMELIKII